MAETIGAIGAAVADSYGQWAANKNLQEDAQSFSKQMSGSAYQRSMMDMRKAGLNPILAYSQGGASTPGGGGGASISAPDILGAISSAKGLQKTDQDIEESKSRQALNLTQGARNVMETDAASQGIAQSRAATEKTQAETAKTKVETQSSSAKAYQDTADAARRSAVGPKTWYTDAMETGGRILNKVGETLGWFNRTPKADAAKAAAPPPRDPSAGLPPVPDVGGRASSAKQAARIDPTSNDAMFPEDISR